MAVVTRHGDTSGSSPITSNEERGEVIVSATEPRRKLGRIWLDTADNSGTSGVRTVVTIISNTTLDLTNDVVLVDTSGGPITVTLPVAADRVGKQFDIKNIGTGVATIDGDGSETIDGSLTIKLSGALKPAATVVNDGSNWWVL